MQPLTASTKFTDGKHFGDHCLKKFFRMTKNETVFFFARMTYVAGRRECYFEKQPITASEKKMLILPE